ncbi:hypothetical protein BT93_I0297 [Corymbia citriodora subsp. variegata]|nr:hypothetical protein BT93_I0297 [Corymbia citriodora subsp. variegata]
MLSARTLSITWGDTPRYWSWNHMPDSRFAEVAELISVCWLEIRGTISSCMLSRGTLYAAYLVFKSTPASYGFDFTSVEVRAGFAGDEAGKRERSVYLSSENSSVSLSTENSTRGWQSRFRRRRIAFRFQPMPINNNHDGDLPAPAGPAPATAQAEPALAEGNGNRPKERRDGWLEIELGEFWTKDGEDGEVEMSVLETKGGNWKGGLILEGIEIRPKHGKEKCLHAGRV